MSHFHDDNMTTSRRWPVNKQVIAMRCQPNVKLQKSTLKFDVGHIRKRLVASSCIVNLTLTALNISKHGSCNWGSFVTEPFQLSPLSVPLNALYRKQWWPCARFNKLPVINWNPRCVICETKIWDRKAI